MAGWQSFEAMYEGYTFIEDASLEERGIKYIYYDPVRDKNIEQR